MDHLAAVQMVRLTEDRYRDIDSDTRTRVAKWLESNEAAEHLIRLVEEGGSFDAEQQGRIFGESLPHGLRMMS